MQINPALIAIVQSIITKLYQNIWGDKWEKNGKQ
jgi:hypothetical protein